MNGIATFFRESRVARFFIPLGIILIAFGIVVFVINNKNKDYIEVESTITNVELSEEAYTDSEGNHYDATYNLTIKYTVDGKEYNGTLDNMPKYDIGKKMTIYYNPKNPSEFTQSKSIILPIIMVAGGIASFVGGIVSASRAVKRHKKMKKQEESWNNGE